MCLLNGPNPLSKNTVTHTPKHQVIFMVMGTWVCALCLWICGFCTYPLTWLNFCQQEAQNIDAHSWWSTPRMWRSSFRTNRLSYPIGRRPKDTVVLVDVQNWLRQPLVNWRQRQICQPQNAQEYQLFNMVNKPVRGVKRCRQLPDMKLRMRAKMSMIGSSC